jgi:DNA-directed RNA polymerase subunit RPC12/RpoP
VEIRKPTWTLKTTCPQCGQGESLVLCACPQCSSVAAVCDEDGAVFLDLRNVRELTATTEEAPCPNCGQRTISQFVSATDQQIVDHGLGRAEYS